MAVTARPQPASAAFGFDAASAPAWAVRDAGGELTGEIDEAGIRVLAGRLPQIAATTLFQGDEWIDYIAPARACQL